MRTADAAAGAALDFSPGTTGNTCVAANHLLTLADVMRIELPDGREYRISLAMIGWGVLAIVLVAGLISIPYQVDAFEEAIVLRFGRHIKTAPPGLHAKLPFGVDRAVKVPVRLVDVEEFGYRSGRRDVDSGRTGFEEETSMLTGDLNIVKAGWDVQFSRVNPKAFLFHVRNPESTLRDISQSVMREVMGDRASIPILTVGRAEIQQRARTLIQQQCDRFQMGIVINEVNLLFVDPPQPVLPAFNDLNKAEQDAVRFFEEASRDYQEKVPQARGQAQRVVLEAEGEFQRRVNIARGEAQRFIEMLQAYEKSPEVTRRRLYLETLEQRLPHLKEVVVVDQELPSVLQHLNLRGGGNVTGEQQ